MFNLLEGKKKTGDIIILLVTWTIFSGSYKEPVLPAGCCGRSTDKKKSMDIVIPSFAGIYNSGPGKDRFPFPRIMHPVICFILTLPAEPFLMLTEIRVK